MGYGADDEWNRLGGRVVAGWGRITAYRRLNGLGRRMIGVALPLAMGGQGLPSIGQWAPCRPFAFICSYVRVLPQEGGERFLLKGMYIHILLHR